MAALCICMGCFPLSAQAVSAALVSPDASVYEQADEESGQIGNLVAGSTFEYTGDVTAEDGSIWHQITTAGGVNGYIRGDREIEVEPAETADPGGQEASPEENENQSAENDPAGGGRGAGEDTGAAPDGEDSGERELSEENEDTEENSTEPAAMNRQNNRMKTYTLDSTGKIKGIESSAGTGSAVRSGEGTGTGADATPFMAAAVVLFSSAAISVCLKRIRMYGGGHLTEERRERAGAVKRPRRKSADRKGKKVVRDRKKGMKTQKEKNREL